MYDYASVNSDVMDSWIVQFYGRWGECVVVWALWDIGTRVGGRGGGGGGESTRS